MALALGKLSQAQAAVTCTGVIREIVTYNGNEYAYILLDTTTRSVYVQTKAAVAMALTAFAIGKTVVMAESGYTICSGAPVNNSWDNVTAISGWFSVNRQ